MLTTNLKDMHYTSISEVLVFCHAVLRIWIQIRIWVDRIHVFLGILDPDQIVRGMDPQHWAHGCVYLRTSSSLCSAMWLWLPALGHLKQNNNKVPLGWGGGYPVLDT
jgi:hypothetical protein